MLAAAAAAAEPARPVVITNPDWLERPSAELLQHYYPVLASTLEFEGRATIACTVNDIGRLEGCKVAGEAPADIGFGAAALSMSHAFRMRPMTRNGEPVAGGTVRIPIRFTLPKAPEPTPPADGPAPTARAIALAQRIVKAQGAEAGMKRQLEALTRALESDSQSGTPEASRVAGIAALRAAYAAHAGELLAVLVAGLTATLSEAELQAFAEFVESPQGAVMRGEGALDAVMGLLANDLQHALLTAARNAYCVSHECQPSTQEIAVFAGPGATDAIDEPEWGETPSLYDLRRATPLLPALLGVRGLARMTCQADIEGLLQACAVDIEAPRGLGYGAAALKLARAYRLGSRQMGQGAKGEKISVRIGFEPMPVPEPYAGPAGRSPEAIAAARRLIHAISPPDTSRVAIGEQVGRLATAPPPEMDPALHAAAIAAIRVGVARAYDDGVEKRANALASQFTTEQLDAATAFRTSPIGRSVLAKSPTFGRTITEGAQRVSRRIAADARAAYCKARNCEGVQPPAR